MHYHALMDPSASIGAKVRHERAERGWSLDRAAVRLGVSRRLLAQIESGAANPSLSTLLSIANGFGIDLTQLIAGVFEGVDVVVQADNASADVLWATEAGSQARLLVGMGPLEMWSWRLAPGESRRSAAHAPGSLEALVVMEGAVEIEVEGSPATTVSGGQSAVFAAHRPHEYRNASASDAEFHMAVFDPIDDTR